MTLTSKKTFMYDDVYLHKLLYTVPRKYSTLKLPHAISFSRGEFTAESVKWKCFKSLGFFFFFYTN